MRISVVLSNDKSQVDSVISELKAIGVNEESIIVGDFSREKLQDTLKEEFEEMSFIKEEMGIFMNVRPFMPSDDVIRNATGMIVSFEITPGRRDEAVEILNKYQPQEVMIKD